MIKLLWKCVFSPKLYKIYYDRSAYQPTVLEVGADTVISAGNIIRGVLYYSSPFIPLYVYNVGVRSLYQTFSNTSLWLGFSCLVAMTLIVRAIGRVSNSKYVEFLNVLDSFDPAQPNYEGIRRYDFDFSAWPVNYQVPRKERQSKWEQHPFSRCANPDLPVIKRSLVQILAYAAAHTFALKLTYPGTMSWIQYLLAAPVLNGRTILVESHNGKRAKIGTADGNEIDTMFIDTRQNSTADNILRNQTLVICCEGNSGFYEIGTMLTPVQAGFSTLGWNHPGFFGSTGFPYPDQEKNAIDAVMQYAINVLGFKPQDIVMYGWSIGGYTATWAAVKYSTKALILDATFDDVLPLALRQMPVSWERLVTEVMKSYIDLNVADLAAQYNGALGIIRRTEDEIICLSPGILATNRGNYLLTRVVEARHPELFQNEGTELKMPLFKYLEMTESQRRVIQRTSQLNDFDALAIQMIHKYMRDVKASHCVPLAEDHFNGILFQALSQKQD